MLLHQRFNFSFEQLGSIHLIETLFPSRLDVFMFTYRHQRHWPGILLNLVLQDLHEVQLPLWFYCPGNQTVNLWRTLKRNQPIKLIDPGDGFQSRLFCEVEAEKDKVCSGNEIAGELEFQPRFQNTWPMLFHSSLSHAKIVTTSFPEPHYGLSFNLIPKWDPGSYLTFSDKFPTVSQWLGCLRWSYFVWYSTRGTSVPSGVLFCKSFERVLHSSVPFHKYFEHPYLLANQLNSNLYIFWPIKIQMNKVEARVTTAGGEILRPNSYVVLLPCQTYYN